MRSCSHGVRVVAVSTSDTHSLALTSAGVSIGLVVRWVSGRWWKKTISVSQTGAPGAGGAGRGTLPGAGFGRAPPQAPPGFGRFCTDAEQLAEGAPAADGRGNACGLGCR